MKKILLTVCAILSLTNFVRSQNGTCIPPIGIDCVTSPMYIDSVYTTAAVANFTNNGTNCNAQDQNYQDYQSKIVTENANGSFVLHIGLNHNVPAYVGVWIDWSDNLVFGASELIYLSPNMITGTSVVVNVPPGPDTVIMRVRCANVSMGPCDSVSTGETEDYRVVVVDASGMNEVKENSWSFYPNPVSDVLHISSSENLPAEISIVDVTGKIVRTVHSPNGIAQIGVSDLAPGVYFLRYVSDGIIETGRFIH